MISKIIEEAKHAVRFPPMPSRGMTAVPKSRLWKLAAVIHHYYPMN
jgi:hypothetical protein